MKKQKTKEKDLTEEQLIESMNKWSRKVFGVKK